MDIEQPSSPATNPNNKTNQQPLLINFDKTNMNKRPSSLKPVQSQVPTRQPPPGWLNWRNKISIATSKSNKSQKDNEKGNKDVTEEIPINKIIIKGFKLKQFPKRNLIKRRITKVFLSRIVLERVVLVLVICLHNSIILA